jgi:DNA-binding transcriptional ArsR family regulator
MIENEDEIGAIIEILYSMKDNIRRKIMKMVFLSGEEGISFKEIVNESGISPTSVAYHLKKLERSGMVKKQFYNLEGRRDYSFYQLTRVGDRAFMMINDIHKDLCGMEDHEQGEILPDIQVIPMRIGPRCVGIERMRG